MPRKYRPPDARRRKGRRAASPHIFEQPAADGDAPSEATSEAGLTVRTPVSGPPIAERPSAVQSARTAATKHISRDYSYVRREIGQIILVAGFLIISLIITALLRK